MNKYTSAKYKDNPVYKHNIMKGAYILLCRVTWDELSASFPGQFILVKYTLIDND